MPDDRIVVLGLVSSKRPALESSVELKARIAEAARFVPLDRLALSPQCGFASTHEGNRLSEDDQKKKLELVARTASEHMDLPLGSITAFVGAPYFLIALRGQEGRS